MNIIRLRAENELLKKQPKTEFLSLVAASVTENY